MTATPERSGLAPPDMFVAFDGAKSALVPVDVIKTTILAGRTIQIYDFNATLNASLLTGRQVVSVTISGLLLTDRIVEIQPTADLPGNLGIAYAFVSVANTLRVAFSTPIVYTGNSSIPLRLTVLR